jgi:hypothetical protein
MQLIRGGKNLFLVFSQIFHRKWMTNMLFFFALSENVQLAKRGRLKTGNTETQGCQVVAVAATFVKCGSF